MTCTPPHASQLCATRQQSLVRPTLQLATECLLRALMCHKCCIYAIAHSASAPHNRAIL